MSSIFIYNLKGGKCVELNTPRIQQEDILKLKSVLPSKLEGLSFESPINKFGEDTISEIRIEDKDPRVAEYLKGIGQKLEQLKQTPGALRFYDLAFRLGGNNEILMMKARTLGQLGYVDRAERLLNHYLKLNPHEPEPFFLLGKHALSRTDYERSKECFEIAHGHIRPNNVEHRRIQGSIDIYLRFVNIYLDRDLLYTRDLSTEKCMEEIRRLRQRTQALIQDIHENSDLDMEGMSFFLETQDKIFERWLEEMKE